MHGLKQKPRRSCQQTEKSSRTAVVKGQTLQSKMHACNNLGQRGASCTQKWLIPWRHFQ